MGKMKAVQVPKPGADFEVDAAYSEFPNYRARAGREIPLFVIEPSRLLNPQIGGSRND